MTARIEISLERYFFEGRRGARACIACGYVGLPRPLAGTDLVLGKKERRCGNCGECSALPLETAASERWLLVVHDGRTLNDTLVAP